MMIDFHPFHMRQLKVQDKQKHYMDHLNDETMINFQGDLYTYVDGEVQAVVGMQKQWSGRAVVFAMIGQVKNWVAFTRQVKAIMNEHANKHGIIRLELTTECDFEQASRWAQMLGFSKESTMKHYGVDGADHVMWVKLYGC